MSGRGAESSRSIRRECRRLWTASTELWRAVRSLPDQQRDAVLLVYAQDLSHGEAAALMGCSEKTVSWRLHEARKRLRILLEAV
jgi:RNA polymerase sigma-70 factor (ECF subfamily)